MQTHVCVSVVALAPSQFTPVSTQQSTQTHCSNFAKTQLVQFWSLLGIAYSPGIQHEQANTKCCHNESCSKSRHTKEPDHSECSISQNGTLRCTCRTRAWGLRCHSIGSMNNCYKNIKGLTHLSNCLESPVCSST